jgi:hypothetical protein
MGNWLPSLFLRFWGFYMISAIGLLGYTSDASLGLNFKNGSAMVYGKMATKLVFEISGVLHDFGHWVIGVHFGCSTGAEF